MIIIAIYGVEEDVVCILVFVKGLIGCAKIIYTSPKLLEYYSFAIVKVHVDGWVQFCVGGYPELGHHCGKGEYIRKGLII